MCDSVNQIDADWRPDDTATLVFVVSESQVLLIRKKRGLGAGKINGPGGKLEAGESLAACAIREIQEEVRITVNDVNARGVLRFQFLDGYKMEVHVFVSNTYEGEPEETEEALPFWCNLSSLPFDQMWADDRYWLQPVLDGHRVEGRFVFDGDKLLDHHVCIDPA